jgi:hypothetical protein
MSGYSGQESPRERDQAAYGVAVVSRTRRFWLPEVSPGPIQGQEPLSGADSGSILAPSAGAGPTSSESAESCPAGPDKREMWRDGAPTEIVESEQSDAKSDPGAET